jgi:selenocysteine lyase/cysteine desulfurase
MDLSETASRFDSSISWIAAVGDEAALSVYDTFGADAIFRRNRELADLLRSAMADTGRQPIDLPVRAARDGNLRLAIHLSNHEDDIEQVTSCLTELWTRKA